jgi:hypothetical protein
MSDAPNPSTTRKHDGEVVADHMTNLGSNGGTDQTQT